ncbi:hypothetical protein GCM10009115_32060 [Sphingopyxis soli]|uniref:Uncharacterized protein n=1 Tax=Sphingopyxis soli TaxID=592051 RepID=A0ABP3XMS1_9SPHN
MPTALACGAATGVEGAVLPVSSRRASKDMAFMLCPNGSGCHGLNLESHRGSHCADPVQT